MFNARASLRLNKRSFKNVAIKTVSLICNNMINEDWNFANRAFDRACGKGHSDKNKKWILDIDDKDYPEGVTDHIIEGVIEVINNSLPEGEKLILTLGTKSGVHLITKPFDLREFKKQFSKIDVHKDNPINLYIP